MWLTQYWMLTIYFRLILLYHTSSNSNVIERTLELLIAIGLSVSKVVDVGVVERRRGCFNGEGDATADVVLVRWNEGSVSASTLADADVVKTVLELWNVCNHLRRQVLFMTNGEFLEQTFHAIF